MPELTVSMINRTKLLLSRYVRPRETFTASDIAKKAAQDYNVSQSTIRQSVSRVLTHSHRSGMSIDDVYYRIVRTQDNVGGWGQATGRPEIRWKLVPEDNHVQ